MSYDIRLQLEKLENNKEWLNILDRLMLNIYNKDDNAFTKAASECREKGIDTNKVETAKQLINFNTKKTKKLNDKKTKELYVFLKSRYPDVPSKEITKCVLRYATLGMGGQQWASNRDFMDIVRRSGITTEAFASPFNNYFKQYYSIFKEDAIFGSLGSFFDSQSEQPIYANPPFTPFILEKLASKICNFKKAILVTPTWTDAPWYKKLSDCGFKAMLKHNTKYTALGKEFTPKFTTTVWTKGVSLAQPP